MGSLRARLARRPLRPLFDARQLAARLYAGKPVPGGKGALRLSAQVLFGSWAR